MLCGVRTTTARGSLRRLPRTRWALLVTASVVIIVVMAVWFTTSLVSAILQRNSDREVFRRAAVAALPPGATDVTTGTLTGTDAYALGDLPRDPDSVIAAYAGPGEAGISWVEIPDSRDALMRYYLSVGKDRLLTVTVSPCQRSRSTCPAGGTTVTAEVSVGGPNS